MHLPRYEYEVLTTDSLLAFPMLASAQTRGGTFSSDKVLNIVASFGRVWGATHLATQPARHEEWLCPNIYITQLILRFAEMLPFPLKTLPSNQQPSNVKNRG